MKGNGISAVLLAAGKGLRFRSGFPKVLHYILDKPMIYYPVRALINSGIRDIVVVLGYGAEQVRDFLKGEFASFKFTFVLQKEQRGTGDAARIALPYVKGKRFILLYGDMPLIDESVLSELIENYRSQDFVLTTFVTDNPAGYGRIIRDANDNLVRCVEDKDATEGEKRIKEVNAGLYLCSTELTRKYITRIKSKNAQNEYYFPDIFHFAMLDNIQVKIFESSEEYLLGANNRVELAHLVRILRDRINKRHMLGGVTIVSPESTYIGIDVVIGRDTIIYPGVFISGRSKIGERVKIENGSIIIDSEVDNDVWIRPYTHIERSVISKKAVLGPFARLRPDTFIDEEGHIGNFVELKKTRFGKRSKANHLSYLGDATIGSDVNIGAGTITCNYDGVKKYETILGDGVFVGSDTQFVAPVRVGSNAYIGAGSTITEDVPPYALSLSRVPQKNIDGWVLKRKKKK